MTQEVVSLKNVKVGDIVRAANGTRCKITSTDSTFPFAHTYIIKGIEIKVDNTLSGHNRYWDIDGYHVHDPYLNIVSIEHNRKFKVGDRFEYASGMIHTIFTIQSIDSNSDFPYVIVGKDSIGITHVQMMSDDMEDMNTNKLKPHNDDPLGFKTAKVGDVYINRDGDELYFVAINPYLLESYPVYLHSMASGTCTYSMDGKFGSESSKWDSKWDVVRKKGVSNDSSK